MEELITGLLSDIGNPITISLLILVGIFLLVKFVWNNWDRLKTGTDYLYQRKKRQEELWTTIDELTGKIKDISQEVYQSKKEQKDFYDKQLIYRDQSREYRDKLENKYDVAISKSNQAFDEIKKTLEIMESMRASQKDYEEKDKERTIVTLRSTIWNLYNEFKRQGFTTQSGLEVFMETCQLYEIEGGNGIVADKLKPEVLELPIKD